MISIIVAMDRHNLIGSSNELPWYLPADLKHFKQKTQGHRVVMGRKTFESIVARIHGPLPERMNVVVTRSGMAAPQGFILVDALEKALAVTDEEELFVIGGAQIYTQTIPLADKLYVTEIDAAFDGDTYFPDIDSDIWKEVARESHLNDEDNPYDYAFVEYEKRAVI